MLALKRKGKFSPTEVQCEGFLCNFKSTVDVQNMRKFNTTFFCLLYGTQTALPELEGALL